MSADVRRGLIMSVFGNGSDAVDCQKWYFGWHPLIEDGYVPVETKNLHVALVKQIVAHST